MTDEPLPPFPPHLPPQSTKASRHTEAATAPHKEAAAGPHKEAGTSPHKEATAAPPETLPHVPELPPLTPAVSARWWSTDSSVGTAEESGDEAGASAFTHFN